MYCPHWHACPLLEHWFDRTGQSTSRVNHPALTHQSSELFYVQGVPKKRTIRFTMNWLPMINIKQCGGQELIIRSQFMAILKLRFLLGHPVYLCQGKRNKYIWAEAVFTAVYVMVLHFRWYFIVCILKFWFSQNQGCADDILKTVRRIENSIWESRMDSVLVGEGRERPKVGGRTVESDQKLEGEK